MKNAVKYTLFLFLISNTLFAQFEIDTFKNKSNTEILNELKYALVGINFMEQLINSPEDIFDLPKEKNKVYNKDEIIPGFQLDTIAVLNTFDELINTKSVLIQDFIETGTQIKVDEGSFYQGIPGEAYTIKFIPNKIYFYDGTTATEGVEEIKLSYFPEKIPYGKSIDSIAGTLKLEYVTVHDKMEVNARKPEVMYNGRFLKIIKTDKNDIEYIYPKGLELDFVEGLNSTGKVLQKKSSYSIGYKMKDLNVFSQIKESLQNIISETEKDTLLDSETFQKKYFSKMEEAGKKLAGGDTLVTIAKYQGKVKGIRAFFVKEKTVPLVIRATRFNDIHVRHDDDESTCLVDNEGRIVLIADKFLRQLNSNFYEGEETFYYFDLSTRKLEKLSYYSLEEEANKYVKARKDENDDYLLLTEKNQSEGTFKRIESFNNTIIAVNDSDVLIIPPNNKQVWFRNIDEISGMFNGYAVIKINDKYGIIDQYGKLVIPTVYDDAKPFSDMAEHTVEDLLFPVNTDGAWGFVDINNKTVIPFEYYNVFPFSYGITLVNKDGGWGLINVKNQVIVPFKGGGSYGLFTNHGKRTYSLSSGKYNYLGVKEK